MTKEQKDFLLSIGVDPNASFDVIEDAVGIYLVAKCLDENYNPTKEGLMCESILDFIGEQ